MDTRIVLPAFALLAVLIFSGCTSAGAPKPTGATAGAADLNISIPTENISEDAKWFEYNSNSTTIRFFAVKGSDGSIKTAFDACDICYYEKKGYSQQGDYMVCNNCGNKYPIDGLGTENKNPGGCWPSYLPNKVIGGDIIIEKADLEKGSAKFA